MKPSTMRLKPSTDVGQGQGVEQSAGIAVDDVDSVHVLQTSGTSWLVRHARVPDRAGSLVGCIEEHDGVYEVMHVNDGFEWQIFMTLAEAIDNLTRQAYSRRASSAADPLSHVPAAMNAALLTSGSGPAAEESLLPRSARSNAEEVNSDALVKVVRNWLRHPGRKVEGGVRSGAGLTLVRR